MQCLFFFFNDTATTEIYTLSLHDALPISMRGFAYQPSSTAEVTRGATEMLGEQVDRKSTRLNSSHTVISYAVFCLKKKNEILCDELLPRECRVASDILSCTQRTSPSCNIS